MLLDEAHETILQLKTQCEDSKSYKVQTDQLVEDFEL